MCVCVCVCVRVRACVRACMRVCGQYRNLNVMPIVYLPTLQKPKYENHTKRSEIHTTCGSYQKYVL